MKPWRDITLGEMQDECKFRGDNCETVGGDRCKFFEVCATMQTIDKGCLTPIMWNLTDPPRFNEAQMAFFRAWYAMGFIRISVLTSGSLLIETLCGTDVMIHNCTPLRGKLSIKIGDAIDLAELLGKDGAE